MRVIPTTPTVNPRQSATLPAPPWAWWAASGPGRCQDFRPSSSFGAGGVTRGPEVRQGTRCHGSEPVASARPSRTAAPHGPRTGRDANRPRPLPPCHIEGPHREPRPNLKVKSSGGPGFLENGSRRIDMVLTRRIEGRAAARHSPGRLRPIPLSTRRDRNTDRESPRNRTGPRRFTGMRVVVRRMARPFGTGLAT